MCRKLELIYSSSLSHWIGSVLYLAPTTNLRLWQLSESQSSASAKIPFTPGLLIHKISNLQPFSDWTSFRKRNTISSWEIASCWSCLSLNRDIQFSKLAITLDQEVREIVAKFNSQRSSQPRGEVRNKIGNYVSDCQVRRQLRNFRTNFGTHSSKVTWNPL